jgi:hypothetical protein
MISARHWKLIGRLLTPLPAIAVLQHQVESPSLSSASPGSVAQTSLVAEMPSLISSSAAPFVSHWSLLIAHVQDETWICAAQRA